MTPKIVYIDMDDTLCDFSGAYHYHLSINPKIQYPQSQYGFFANLHPLPGAISAVKALIHSEKYDPYILTAPSVLNPLCYTEKRIWIENHFGIEFVDKLIISPNKSLLKGDILIDDNIEGKGQDLFEGYLIHFGSNGYPDWNSIRRELDF